MKYLFLKLLPKNLFSKLMGHLAEIKAPAPLLESVIRTYADFYKIDLNEMKKPLSEINCFNEFFTRELKDGLRPVDEAADSLTSPVDGTIAEYGAIKDGLLIQTKGIYYSLSDLVGPKDAETFDDGYFMTIYLSPADYHRIHTPFQGEVNRFSYFSGNLWPVNHFAVENIGGLFSINERIFTPLETAKGLIGMIKVGATVVGKIKTTYHPLESNDNKGTKCDLPVTPSRTFAKGQEIGRFQLGSTVILLMEKGRFKEGSISRGQKVKMGEAIGTMQ